MINLKKFRALVALLPILACAGMGGALGMDDDAKAGRVTRVSNIVTGDLNKAAGFANDANGHEARAELAKNSWFADDKTIDYCGAIGCECDTAKSAAEVCARYIKDLGENKGSYVTGGGKAGLINEPLRQCRLAEDAAKNARLNANFATDCVNLNKAETVTAFGSLMLFELSLFIKDEKAIVARMLAEILSLINDGVALGNEMYKERNTFLDYTTGVSMASRIAMLIALGKKLVLFDKSAEYDDEDEYFDLDENISNSKPEKKTKVNKIVAAARALGKYAPHFERVAALVRAGTKFGKLESGKAAQICTFLITLCRAAEMSVETAESDSQILKAAPLVMVAISMVVAVVDQFIPTHAIWNK